MAYARLVVLFLWIGGVCAHPGYPFTLDFENEPGGQVMFARNDGPAPVSVLVRLTVSENVVSDGALPVVAVVAPRSRQRLVRLSQENRRLAWRYQYGWSWRLGDYKATHHSYAAYRVPWLDGRAFRIGQAPGGRITTHDKPWNRNAIDVSMPEGTPIVAARAGTVVEVTEGFSEGGKDESFVNQANVVRLVHEDGTLAEYVHLMQGGSAVRVGEKVAAGKLIGYSGNTGFSSGPHLHFAVLRVVREGDTFQYVSEPFSFYVGRPAHVFFPKTGLVVPANYTSPGKSF
jgi:murein DD-endopeptidase MepM/ murein hydrolase activator NlpD